MKSAFFTLVTIILWATAWSIRAEEKAADLPRQVAALIQEQHAKDREIHYFNLWVGAEEQKEMSFSCFFAAEQAYYLFLIGLEDHDCNPNQLLVESDKIAMDKPHVKGFQFKTMDDDYMEIDLFCEDGDTSPLYLLIVKANAAEV